MGKANASRLARTVAALGLGFSAISMAAPQPATAGAFDGDVTNWLPHPKYTVKIATFSGPNREEWCPAYNDATTYLCRNYWLPYGKADDQLRGNNWDTDGLMVESPYTVQFVDGHYNVPARRWFKLGVGSNATCREESGRPVCRM